MLRGHALFNCSQLCGVPTEEGRPGPLNPAGLTRCLGLWGEEAGTHNKIPTVGDRFHAQATFVCTIPNALKGRLGGFPTSQPATRCDPRSCDDRFSQTRIRKFIQRVESFGIVQILGRIKSAGASQIPAGHGADKGHARAKRVCWPSVGGLGRLLQSPTRMRSRSWRTEFYWRCDRMRGSTTTTRPIIAAPINMAEQQRLRITRLFWLGRGAPDQATRCERLRGRR